MEIGQSILLSVEKGFSLAASAGPVRWSGERSPRHGIIGRSLISIEQTGDNLVGRVVEQGPDGEVRLHALTDSAGHQMWFDRTFRPMHRPETWNDAILDPIARSLPGLRAFTDGSLFMGLVTSIIGQSISLASASAVQQRLAASFSRGIEISGRRFVPLPDAGYLATTSVETLRAAGMTWKRAEAMSHIAREEILGNLPTDDDAAREPASVEKELRKLPLVGPWTAASALLWGIAATDAFPSGDVALLRAARLAYDQETMSMRELDALAERWRPYRGTATRLLWSHILGPAW